MMNTTETNQTTPVVLQRLESEIDWYDKKSVHNQHMFKRLKTATLAISVSIPLCAKTAGSLHFRASQLS